MTRRQEHVAGLACLLMCRVVLPSYDFLAAYRAKGLLDGCARSCGPRCCHLENAAAERGLSGRDRSDALSMISKIVLHTGTDVDALTADDILEVYAWSVHSQRRQVPGLHAAWDLLGVIGVTPAELTLRSALRRGQRSTTELVDDYDICCRPIRDVFIRYLSERRPALDYNSLISLAGELVGAFWADIERHHPGIDTLHLPEEIAQAWKERVRVVTATDGTVRERKNIHALLMRVRAFYLDIQQWALEDPSWVPWAVPSPVRKGDTLGYEKARRKTVAAMHQRVRERLPHLPALADAAGRCLAETTALLTAATEREPGEVFDHAGTRYRRTAPKSADLAARHQGSPAITVKNLVTGEAINLTRREDEAFWAWAIIETRACQAFAWKNCWRSPTWRWCPTSCPAAVRSCPCCRSCLPRATKNACCWWTRNSPASWPPSSPGYAPATAAASRSSLATTTTNASPGHSCRTSSNVPAAPGAR